jgi:23S rRNA pseudouridine2604 synthase
MSEQGLCSRREADRFIEQGWVKVDGEIIKQLGTRVDPGAKIEILKVGQQKLDKKVTILINKPVGYVSSQPEHGYESAMALITDSNRDISENATLHTSNFRGLGPAGRLDIDSQGLLIFTQDGVLAKQIIGENSECEKEYLVRVEGSLSDAGLAKLRHGLVLDGKPLKPAQVQWLNEDQLRFILQEGKKRQIRRMCEAVGLEVMGLKRVRVGGLMLGNLEEGCWRFLRPEEHVLLGGSAKAREGHSRPQSRRR